MERRAEFPGGHLPAMGLHGPQCTRLPLRWPGGSPLRAAGGRPAGTPARPNPVSCSRFRRQIEARRSARLDLASAIQGSLL